jgi:hypothetical protein
VDRDVYLILIGAGISLASSVVTLILQFLLGLISERMHSKREEKREQSRNIRAAIMDKSLSPEIKKAGTLLKRIMPDISADDLDLPSFLRNKDKDQRSLTPAKKFTIQYFWAITIGILVFLFWLVYIFLSKAIGQPL